MNEERRKSLRVHTYLPVRLEQRHQPHPIQTLTKDVGAGGLRCITQTVTPVLTELTVELVLEHGAAPLTLKGKAAWFRMIPHSDQFDLGVSFTQTPEEIQQRLSGYLERYGSSPASISA